MEGKMIDIISSSIRLGKLLREHSELNDIAVFFSQIENEKSNPWALEYVKLISSKLRQYGLYAFDVVDQILIQNLKNEDDFVKRMASEIRTFVTVKPNYKEILGSSQGLL